MSIATKCGLKRLFRVVLAGCIAGGLSSFVGEIESNTVYFFIVPAVTGVISSIGKYIREKWNVEVLI